MTPAPGKALVVQNHQKKFTKLQKKNKKIQKRNYFLSDKKSQNCLVVGWTQKGKKGKTNFK